MCKIFFLTAEKQHFYVRLKGDALTTVVFFQPFFGQNCCKETNDYERYDKRSFPI